MVDSIDNENTPRHAKEDLEEAIQAADSISHEQRQLHLKERLERAMAKIREHKKEICKNILKEPDGEFHDPRMEYEEDKKMWMLNISGKNSALQYMTNIDVRAIKSNQSYRN
jgi:hypothetical protein